MTDDKRMGADRQTVNIITTTHGVNCHVTVTKQAQLKTPRFTSCFNDWFYKLL